MCPPPTPFILGKFSTPSPCRRTRWAEVKRAAQNFTFCSGREDDISEQYHHTINAVFLLEAIILAFDAIILRSNNGANVTGVITIRSDNDFLLAQMLIIKAITFLRSVNALCNKA